MVYLYLTQEALLLPLLGVSKDSLEPIYTVEYLLDFSEPPLASIFAREDQAQQVKIVNVLILFLFKLTFFVLDPTLHKGSDLPLIWILQCGLDFLSWETLKLAETRSEVCTG